MKHLRLAALAILLVFMAGGVAFAQTPGGAVSRNTWINSTVPSCFPNNNIGRITPLQMRNCMTALANSVLFSDSALSDLPSGPSTMPDAFTYPDPTFTGTGIFPNGWIPNSALAHASTTVNGTVCTLGSTCNPASGSGTVNSGSSGQVGYYASTGTAISGESLSALLDASLGSTQGSVLYRGASTWTVLTPGTSGFFLETQGSSANPTWAPASGGSGCSTGGSAGNLLTSNGSGGCTTDTNSSLTNGALSLGSSGTAGSVAMGNATSGTVTIQPATGALGSSVLSAPAHTGTLADSTDNLGFFASTTSAQLAGVISDETGSGSLVFATSPTLVTPALGTPTALVCTNCTGTASGLTAGAVPLSGITGLGTGVATAAALTTNAAGALALVNGSPTIGDCLEWSSTGVEDSGSGCGISGADQVFLAGVGFTPGTTTSLTLTATPSAANVVRVIFDGIWQISNTWSLSTNVITFTNPIPASVQVVEVQQGGSGGGGGGGGSPGGSTGAIQWNNAGALAGTSVVSGDVVTGGGASGPVDSGTLLSALAPLVSPSLTGTPTAPTATTGTNTTQIATTAFVLANAGSGTPLYTNDGTFRSTGHIVIGTATSSFQPYTVSLSGSSAFSSSSSYQCMISQKGSGAAVFNEYTLSYSSGSSFSVFANNSSGVTISYVCAGY